MTTLAAASLPAGAVPSENTGVVRQPIIVGAGVDIPTQRRLGLVAVNGGCSGTLLNTYWVLTARHCVTTDGTITHTLRPASQITISAAWTPLTASATAYHEFSVNQPTPVRDIVMVYLGLGHLAWEGENQPYLSTAASNSPDHGRDDPPGTWRGARLKDTDTVTQYGRGYTRYASGTLGTPTARLSQGAGTYHSATFTPSGISDTAYTLRANTAGQVGAGGDSGGPTLVARPGGGWAIAGVQSTCIATGYLPIAPGFAAPADYPGWAYATGESSCQYVSTETLVREIGEAMQQSPDPKTPASAALRALPVIVDALLQ